MAGGGRGADESRGREGKLLQKKITAINATTAVTIDV